MSENFKLQLEVWMRWHPVRQLRFTALHFVCYVCVLMWFLRNRRRLNSQEKSSSTLRTHCLLTWIWLFHHFLTFLELSTNGAVLSHVVWGQRRDRRVGAQVYLRRRGLCTLLPAILLVNLRSRYSKVDELRLMITRKPCISLTSALCFTETWLNEMIPDSALHLPGFRIYRTDRGTEVYGKSKGCRIWFYINENWSNDVTILLKSCSTDLEYFFTNCKPFYSPRDLFWSAFRIRPKPVRVACNKILPNK